LLIDRPTECTQWCSPFENIPQFRLRDVLRLLKESPIRLAGRKGHTGGARSEGEMGPTKYRESGLGTNLEELPVLGDQQDKIIAVHDHTGGLF
jgi:hypothetical protein